MKKIFSFIFELLKIVVIAGLIVIPIRYFIFQPFFVRGDSMEPNFHSGDYLIVDEITYRFHSPKRGDVVVFKFPENPSQRFIKRIIGLPGETVEIKDGKIMISKDGKTKILNESNYLGKDVYTKGNIKVSLGKDEFFVLGDNRSFSFDSRRFGVLPRKYIIGRVIFRLASFSSFAKVVTPSY